MQCGRPFVGAWIVLVALPFLTTAGEDCPEPVSPTERQEAFTCYGRAQELLDAGHGAEAEEQLLTATRLDPLLLLGHYGLGEIYMAQKRFPEAVKAFTACKEAFRCMGLSLAERLEIRKLLDEASRELSDAVRRVEQLRMARALILWQELNRASPPTMGQSALLVQQLEKRLMQLEEWKRRLNQPRPPAQVFLALGAAYFHTGSLVDAEREYREALEVDPRLGDAHNNLAVVYMLTDRLEDAEREVKLAEKAGTPVNPRLKDEIKKRKAQAR